MSDFCIATASTADLDREYLDSHGIPFISYSYLIEGENHYDDCRYDTRKKMFDAMRKGHMPGTAQITQEEYYAFFCSLLDKGRDVLYLDMSRAISNSYNNALAAGARVREKYPGLKFHIADTGCITGGLAFLVTNVVRKKEAGASFEECVNYVEDIKLSVIHHFTVDDLKWLRKGGRLSNASAVIGTLLNIKPMLYVADDGSLVASSKVRGRKTCLGNMIKGMEKDLGDPEGKEIFITHGDCEDEALKMVEDMKKAYPALGNIETLMLGPTIGAHVGPGFIGIFYFGTGRYF